MNESSQQSTAYLPSGQRGSRAVDGSLLEGLQFEIDTVYGYFSYKFD